MHSAWWKWIVANGFPLLAAGYLASALCLIALACCVFMLLRRLAHVVGRVDAQAVLLSKLAASENAQARAVEVFGRRLADHLHRCAEADLGEAAGGRISRQELQSLLDEVSVEGTPRT